MAKTAQSEFQKRLKDAQGAWAEDSQTPTQYETSPTGVFLGRVQALTLQKSDKGNWGISTEIVICEGEHVGRVLRMWVMVIDAEGNTQARNVFLLFQNMGCDDLFPEDQQDLENALSKAVMRRPAVKVRSTANPKSDFPNVRMLGPAAEEDMEAIPEAEEPPKPAKKKAAQADDDEEDEDEKEEEEDEEDDAGPLLDGMDRGELKEYIRDKELDVRVTKSMSDDDVRQAILETLSIPDDAEGEGEGDGSADGKKVEMLAFCEANDITVDENDDADTIANTIIEYAEYQSAELTDGEIEMLNSIGATVVTFGKSSIPAAKEPKPSSGGKKPSPAANKVKMTDEEKLKALETFCARFEGAAPKRKTLPDYAKKLNEIAWTAGDLKPAEVVLLRSIKVEVED